MSLVGVRHRRSQLAIPSQLRLFCLQHFHSLGKHSVARHAPKAAEQLNTSLDLIARLLDARIGHLPAPRLIT